MEAMKKFSKVIESVSMEKLVELSMEKLFMLFEYVDTKCPFMVEKPKVTQTQPKQVMPPIYFTNDDKLVEGELFV